jgi:hypothetical protein
VRVQVSCLGRTGGFAAPCDRCGERSSIAVRSLWRTAHAPLAAMRYYFCDRHRRDALILQTELVAEAAARRYASPEGPAAVRFPFPLPRNFLAQLGCPQRDGLVALSWDPAADRLEIEARGRTSVSRLDAGPWFHLVRRPAAALWLQEHMLCLGSRHESASHALLVDCDRGTAVVARASAARRTVTTRSRHAEHAPHAAGTPKGGS